MKFRTKNVRYILVRLLHVRAHVLPFPRRRLHHIITRMHSCRMRTVCCSGCRGGRGGGTCNPACTGQVGCVSQHSLGRGCLLRGGVCPGGVCPRGVCQGWGVCPCGVSAHVGCLPRGCVCPGGVCQEVSVTHPLWTE